MAAPPAQQKSNWADDEDLDETTASTELPPPQRLQNKDGTVTEITYRLDDQGRKIKTTRRLRHVTRREVVNPRVAERKTWAKFGDSAGEPQGPNTNTTTLADDIPFRLSTNYYRDAKDEAKQAENTSAKEKLKTANVKCRICNGEHFTARCPYKETMAPIGGDGNTADVAAGMGDEEALGGAGGAAGGAAATGKKGSYVPPALRGDRAAAREGGGMGSKYGERDDLATLRVTNISEMAEEQELRDMFERFGRVTRVFLAKDRDTGMAKGFAFISFVDREDAVKACNRMDGFGYKHLILKVEFAKKAQ